jgi:hypothetical protein
MSKTKIAWIRRPLAWVGLTGMCLCCAILGLLGVFIHWQNESVLTRDEIEECLAKPHESWDSLAKCLCEHSEAGNREVFESRAITGYEKINGFLLHGDIGERLVLNTRGGAQRGDLNQVVQAMWVGADKLGSWGSGGAVYEWYILVDKRGRLVGWVPMFNDPAP